MEQLFSWNGANQTHWRETKQGGLPWHSQLLQLSVHSQVSSPVNTEMNGGRGGGIWLIQRTRQKVQKMEIKNTQQESDLPRVSSHLKLFPLSTTNRTQWLINRASGLASSCSWAILAVTAHEGPSPYKGQRCHLPPLPPLPQALTPWQPN